MGTFLKALFMASSRRLKVGCEICDIYYLFRKVIGFLSSNFHPMYFWGQFLRKIGWFKTLQLAWSHHDLIGHHYNIHNKT
jgi:hypothetical protein